MKMVKSHTKRKSSNQDVYVPPEVSREIDQTTRRIKRWTNKELGSLQQQKTPICIPTETGYRIGHFVLRVYPNKTCDVTDADHYLIHSFRDKISAVLYAIYTIKGNYTVANNILFLDKEINKNYTDIVFMRRCAEAARKRKEYNVADVRQARIAQSEHRLRIAEQELSAIRTTAKINKVWE